MRLYSESQIKNFAELHGRDKYYDNESLKWVMAVWSLCENTKLRDVLDYGCGKGALSLNIPFRIQNYDPAVTNFKQSPNPAQIVVCTNVLECVEKEFLDNVLQDLKEKTLNCVFISIKTTPSKNKLQDGSNEFKTIANKTWWESKISEFFIIDMIKEENGEIMMLCFKNTRGTEDA